MKIILFGKNGQLGYEILNKISSYPSILALGKHECDLNNLLSLKKIIRDYKPDIIINAAAYTDVEKAEKNKKIVDAVNFLAPKVMAEEAEKLNSLLIHFSTDYVFDGKKQGAYLEDDKTNPLNAYGFSKLNGDLSIQKICTKYFILRTSWVNGSHGKSFVSKILYYANKNDKLKVVNDQYGAPTFAKSLAELTDLIVKKYLDNNNNISYGLYNATASGKTTWYNLAKYIVLKARSIRENIKIMPNNIIAINSSEYNSNTIRPKNSILSSKKLEKNFNFKLPTWQKGIDEILEKIL